MKLSCSVKSENRHRRIDESTRLPPMWPGFDTQTRRYLRFEFVDVSHPCSKCFSTGSLVYLHPQKSAFPNFNSIGNPRATGLLDSVC